MTQALENRKTFHQKYWCSKQCGFGSHDPLETFAHVRAGSCKTQSQRERKTQSENQMQFQW